jgi:hypothetical protein
MRRRDRQVHCADASRLSPLRRSVRR